MPWVDFIQRQRALQRGAKRHCIVAPAGANRLERCDFHAARAQELRQQRGQNGFADAGVRAGDEESWLHFADMKAESSILRHQNNLPLCRRLFMLRGSFNL
jgi:hypothetical protein